jgi:hypothetical protein
MRERPTCSRKSLATQLLYTSTTNHLLSRIYSPQKEIKPFICSVISLGLSSSKPAGRLKGEHEENERPARVK